MLHAAMIVQDLIIEAIYRNILQAKLDQRNKQVNTQHPILVAFLICVLLLFCEQLEVECFIGRDIRMERLDGMVTKLEQW